MNYSLHAYLSIHLLCNSMKRFFFLFFVFCLININIYIKIQDLITVKNPFKEL